MTIAELLAKYARTIEIIANRTGLTNKEVQAFFEVAWEEGYAFRLQEEELNKGASY